MPAGPPRVAIVGLGLMGGSLALALRRARPGWRLLGVDSSERARTRALELGAVDDASSELEPAELVFLAVPIEAMDSRLKEVAAIAPGAVVSDLGSVKRQVMAMAAAAGVDLVGGHPLCGREVGGIDAASNTLFEGAAWALTRPDPAVEEVVAAVGAHPLVLDADEHDRLVAGISHAAFVVSAAYMLACEHAPDWPAMAALAAGGFRDMTRLAAGDPVMYALTAGANRDHLLARLDDFQAALGALRSGLERNQPDLLDLFGTAAAARRRWEAGRNS